MDKKRVTFYLDYDIPNEKEMYDYLESFKRKKSEIIKEAVAQYMVNDNSKIILSIIVDAVLKDSRLKNLNFPKQTNSNEGLVSQELIHKNETKKNSTVLKDEDNIQDNESIDENVLINEDVNIEDSEIEDDMKSVQLPHRRRRIVENEEIENEDNEELSDEAMNLLMKQMSLMGV